MLNLLGARAPLSDIGWCPSHISDRRPDVRRWPFRRPVAGEAG